MFAAQATPSLTPNLGQGLCRCLDRSGRAPVFCRRAENTENGKTRHVHVCSCCQDSVCPGRERGLGFSAMPVVHRCPLCHPGMPPARLSWGHSVSAGLHHRRARVVLGQRCGLRRDRAIGPHPNPHSGAGQPPFREDSLSQRAQTIPT